MSEIDVEMVEVICPECHNSFNHDASKITEFISLIYCPGCNKPMIIRVPAEQLPIIQANGGTIKAERVKTYNLPKDPESSYLHETSPHLQPPF